MKSVSVIFVCLTASALGCSSNSTDPGNSGGVPGAGGAPASSGARSTTGGAGAAGTGSSNTAARSGGGSSGAISTVGSAATSNAGGQAGGGKSAAGGAKAGGAGAGGAGAGGAGAGGAQAGKSGSGGPSAGGPATGGKSGSTGQAMSGSPATGGTDAGGQGAGGKAGGSATSAGCGKAPSIPSSQFNNGSPISITVGGLQRRYIVNVPTNYDNSHPYRLVVTLHQRDGNDKQMHNWKYYGLLPESNDTAIFVAPNGQKNNAPCSGTGDGDSNCGWPNPSGQDLALVDAVVAQAKENFCIDTDRIFATGWSYGGSMSYQVACERPIGGTKADWGVRGIAVYSAAQLSGSCTPSKPVAYFHAHGTRDSVLNYESMGMPLAQNFAKANGCTWATPTKVSSGAHVCTNLAGCQSGYPLEFCSFNGDHTPFPDNGQAQGSWGPAEAWKFLSQF